MLGAVVTCNVNHCMMQHACIAMCAACCIFVPCPQVGAHHELSAGLLIGGKNVREERQAVSRMNILVATPGTMPSRASGTSPLMAHSFIVRGLSHMLQHCTLLQYFPGNSIVSLLHLLQSHQSCPHLLANSWQLLPTNSTWLLLEAVGVGHGREILQSATS